MVFRKGCVFLSLAPATVVWVVLAGGMAIAVLAILIAAYLRLQVAAPLVVSGLILLRWVGLGIGQGIALTALFGVSLYALYLSPVYIGD